MDRHGLASQGSRAGGGRGAGNCFPAPKAAGLCVDTDSSCLPRTASPPPDPGLSDVSHSPVLSQGSDMLACLNCTALGLISDREGKMAGCLTLQGVGALHLVGSHLREERLPLVLLLVPCRAGPCLCAFQRCSRAGRALTFSNSFSGFELLQVFPTILHSEILYTRVPFVATRQLQCELLQGSPWSELPGPRTVEPEQAMGPSQCFTSVGADVGPCLTSQRPHHWVPL